MARVSEQSQQELNDSRRIIRQKEDDIENLTRKLKKSWCSESKLQKKVKQLAMELESALKRVSYKRTPQRRSRDNSPYTSKRRTSGGG